MRAARVHPLIDIGESKHKLQANPARNISIQFIKVSYGMSGAVRNYTRQAAKLSFIYMSNAKSPWGS